MISCGWCGHPTLPPVCGSCGHVDPARPWVQRGQEPPQIERPPGRPVSDPATVARRLAAARQALIAEGRTPTIDALAEALDVSPRTVRRWKMAG